MTNTSSQTEEEEVVNVRGSGCGLCLSLHPWFGSWSSSGDTHLFATHLFLQLSQPSGPFLLRVGARAGRVCAALAGAGALAHHRRGRDRTG